MISIQSTSAIATTRFEDDFVWLYTCYPKAITLDNGPLGEFRAPACPEDKPYVRFKIHSVTQPVYMGSSDFDELSGIAKYTYVPVKTEAKDIAQDFVDRRGVRFGIFKSDTDGEPSKACIEAAVRGMYRSFVEIVEKADADWEAHHNRLRITQEARDAARYIKAELPWVAPSTSVDIGSIIRQRLASVPVPAGAGAPK